ncbi:MAG: ACP S-malonyltransferase, partial [Mailhella sp.]|nr:ACP S-malonyltransferase [Mailhella sp.]
RFKIRNELMPRQLVSRVRWLETIRAMLADGVELFVELGPKNVLTGMMKKILPKGSPVRCLQADSPEALDAAAAAIQS